MSRKIVVSADKLLQIARFLNGIGTGNEVTFAIIQKRFNLPITWKGHLITMGFISHQNPMLALQRQGKRGFQQLVVGPGPFNMETIEMFLNLRRGVSKVTTTITERVVERVIEQTSHIEREEEPEEEEYYPQPEENDSAVDLHLKQHPYGRPFVRPVVAPSPVVPPEVNELSKLVRDLHKKITTPPPAPVIPPAPVVKKKEYKSVEVDLFSIVDDVCKVATGVRSGFYRPEDVCHPNVMRLIRAKLDAMITDDVTTVIFMGGAPSVVFLQAGVLATRKGCEVLYRTKNGDAVRL